MTPDGIRLVVFDWAGTIIDYGSLAPLSAFIDVFAARGVPVSAEEARRPMGTHKREHLERLHADPEVAARWLVKHGGPCDAATMDAMYAELVPLQLAAIDRHSRLVPGLAECAAWLRKNGIRTAGTTGYFAEAASRVLAAAKAQGYEPDANACADDVSQGRPAPWMIWRVMERLNVWPAAHVVKIGDTVVDIEEGRNAGCWTIGVVESSSEMGLSQEEFLALRPEEREARTVAVRETFLNAGADGVIDTLADVPELIESLNERVRVGEVP